MSNSQLVVTSLEKLKSYAGGNIVQLPSFAEGQPFVARLKRPSLMALAKQGKIPNALLVKANELFTNEAGHDPEDENMMAEMFDVLEVMAEATFVEPTYEQIKQAGVELTDEQMMFIFTYGQKGVQALEMFRTDTED